MKKDIKTIILTIIIAFGLLALLGYVFKISNISESDTLSNKASETKFDNDNLSQKDMDLFAQCLAEKQITMYGAEWCTHCKKEKAAFGSSFKYVPYVECPDNIKICLEKGVNGYPTWITSDGSKYEGEQGIERLAEITGCSLSNEESSKEDSFSTTSSTTTEK